MTDKPPTPEDAAAEQEAELALLMTYHRALQTEEFFGIVTISYNKGEVKHLREDRTRPPAALTADLWDKLPERVKPTLRKKFKDSKAFDVEG